MKLPAIVGVLLLFQITQTASAQALLWPTAQQWDLLRQRMATEPDVRRTMANQRRIADDAISADPQPIAIITTGGRLQGDPLKAQTESSMKDMDKIQALAVSYRAYGDARYAARAGEYLEAWAKINQPTGQPIDETGMEPAIFGYRIVRPELSDEARRHVDNWMHSIAQAEIRSRDMTRGTAINNWHSHRLKTVGLIGYALGDAALVTYAKDGFKAQINDNLRQNGESIDFLERDALAYHVYDLRPLTMLALAFAEDGEDLYHWQAPNGASVAHSVEWLLPYVKGDKTHAEFVGTNVPFDKARANNHEKGHEIGAPYDPKNAQPLMDLAAAYDPACAALARQLAPSGMRLRFLLESLAPGVRLPVACPV